MVQEIYIDKYHLIRKIGQGKFSAIYLGTDGSQEVAIKLQSINSKKFSLEHEANVYKELADEELAGDVGIPTVHFSGLPSADYYAIVIDLLGPSLEDLFNFCERKFSLNTVLLLFHQQISLIEYIHTKNYVHGDVNPEHFLMGRGKQGNQVNIIGFGLAQPFGNKENGTSHSASINVHQGNSKSTCYIKLTALISFH
jgi:casein kinase I family protein HRR25